MTDRKLLKVILNSTNETIGHCELNFENGNYRLSRILVGNKDLRRQKIGEEIVRKMVDLFLLDQDVKEVDLNVFEWNKGAIRCYEKVGFRIDHDKTDELTVNGKISTILNMVLKRN